MTEVDVFQLLTAFQTTEHDHLDVAGFESLEFGHSFERHQVGNRCVRDVQFLNSLVPFEAFVSFCDRRDVVVTQIDLYQVWHCYRRDFVDLCVVQQHKLQPRPVSHFFTLGRLSVQTRERVDRVET